VKAVHVLRGKPGHQPFEDFTDIQQLDHLLRTELGHRDAHERRPGDQPLHLQLPDCLADRRAAHFEFGGEILFRELRSRLQRTAEDRGANALADLLGRERLGTSRSKCVGLP
jgi:hypothetical protein